MLTTNINITLIIYLKPKINGCKYAPIYLKLIIYLIAYYLLYFIAACAAAKRAIGMRNGEQLT